MTEEPMTDMALYEYIHERKWTRKWSFQEISDALQFGLDRKSMQKKYKRLCDKVGKPYKPLPVVEPVASYDDKPDRRDLSGRDRDDVSGAREAYDAEVEDTIEYGELTDLVFNEVDWDDKEAYVDRVIEWMYLYASEWFHWEPCPEYIREMIMILLYGDKITLLEPRFHGKTNTLVCLFAYWMIELRKTVMVILQVNHQNILNMIEGIFESEAVMRDYGQLIENKLGRPKYEIRLVDEYQHGHAFAFFKACSLEGSYAGLHPNWTHMDDIVQKKIRNKDTFKYFMQDFDQNVLDLSPDKTTISGTRKEMGDFYDMSFDRGFLPLHNKAIEFLRGTYPSMDDAILRERMYRGKMRTQVIGFKQEYLDSIEVKTMGCPNYGTVKILARYLTNPNSFFSQMQNEPVPMAGNIFKPHWIKEKKYSEMPDNFDRMDKENVVDPAFGSTYSSSDTAMIIGGMFEGKMYVTDIIAGKFPNDEIIDEMERVRAVSGAQLTHCEDDFAQISNRFDKSSRFWEVCTNLYSNKGKGSKRDRVSNLSNPLRFGHVVFMEGCTHWELFEAQYLRYDASSDKGIDILDALASAYRLIYEGEDNEEEDEAWAVVGGSEGYI